MLAGVELPSFEAQGAAGGPHLCLLAGIHGGEYSSIAAVIRFMRDLDPGALSGRITAGDDVAGSNRGLPPARVRRPQPEDELRSGAKGGHEGTTLGAVKNLFGDPLEDVVAPEDGVVLFLTSSPAVTADGLLLGLGAGLAAINLS